MRNRILLIAVLSTIIWPAIAQEPQFTQFYAAPMYLNPAFTGLTYEHRFTAAYRRQWPGIQRTFSTYMAGYDYNLAELNSGIGGFALQDRAGTSNLTTTTGGLQYAYRIKVNKTAELRAGLSAALSQKKLDFGRLVFNDQLISGSAITIDTRAEQINFLDMGAGVLYNTNTYWGGISARHINQPNGSMTGNFEAIPVYLSVHGGYRYILQTIGSQRKLEEYVSASFNYRKEDKFDQLDIGAYYFKQVLNVGLWYRGLPFKKYKPGYPSRESIAILLGVEVPEKMLRVGYSFDVTISNLGVGSTQGSHEITLVYEVAKKYKRTRRVVVSCPKF